jgi:Flp pilus assembly protein TadG
LAVCLPVFFLIVFFFIESWRFMSFQHAIDHATFEAARRAVVPGATPAEAEARAQQILDAFGATTATISVTPTTFDESTEEVTVSVSLDYADVAFLFNPQYSLSYPDRVLNSTLTLDHENARVGRAGQGTL